MALKSNIQLDGSYGTKVTFEDCYLKVEGIDGSKEALVMSVSVRKNQNDNELTRLHYRFVPSLDGSNFIAQAYQYLKTLPEYSGAVDC